MATGSSWGPWVQGCRDEWMNGEALTLCWRLPGSTLAWQISQPPLLELAQVFLPEAAPRSLLRTSMNSLMRMN